MKPKRKVATPNLHSITLQCESHYFTLPKSERSLMRIFISYSRKDKDILAKIVKLIEATHGNDSFWNDRKTHGGINVSDDWWHRIEQEFHNCTAFMFLISNSALASPNCQKELNLLSNTPKTFLPIIVETIPNFPNDLPDELDNSIKNLGSFGFRVESAKSQAKRANPVKSSRMRWNK